MAVQHRRTVRQQLGALAIAQRTQGRAKDVADSVESLLGRIEGALDARAKTLNETLSQRAVEIARALADGGRQATGEFDDAARRVADAAPRAAAV